MSSRTSSLCLALLLAACGTSEEDKVASAAPDERIECAVDGAAEFTQTCAIERGEGTALVMRHVGGGFRRIDLADDGTIGTADGSDAADGNPMPDGRFELIVGDDRYRLPKRK